MRKHIYQLIVLAAIISGIGIAAIMAGCAQNAEKSNANIAATPYNPFVEAFTTGEVSRFAPIYLILTQDVPQEHRESGELARYIKISPSADGEYIFENSRTIVFKPSEAGLKRNTEYRVTADLSHWFDAGSDNKSFAFAFSTLPLELHANFESLTTTDRSSQYSVDVSMLTPDREDGADVEGMVSFSEKADASWEHSSDGRRHTLTLSNIEAHDKERSLELSIGRNKLGAKQRKLLEIKIPRRDDFRIYNVTFVPYPSRYVEVVFTEQLDDNQDLHGMAFIENNKSEIVTVNANKLRLYPDTNREGVLDIFLGGAIRSKNGHKLGEDAVRQVNAESAKPSVEFAGNGVIIPLSGKITVPFRAINLKGVIVKIIKIYENNIGQFLQENTLHDASSLARVGKLISRKVVFLDGQGSNLSQWNTFALDLGKFMKPEPGAIYRVILNFTRDLSVYPCEEPSTKTREQIVAEEEALFRKETERFDDGDYYYYWDDHDYLYSYRERENPCSDSYYRYRSVGRNIFATDLGVIAGSGEGNEMTVLVHNLLTTQPESGVEVKLYNYQLQLMGRGATDANGRTNVDYKSGKPFYVLASKGKQRCYLRVDTGSALSMSSFDVSGAVVQRGIKGFIYGERGVWRPGDTIHLGFMLNDKDGKLPADHPVTLELQNPLGQSYATITQTSNKLGLYTFNVTTEPDAPTGAWNARINVGGVTFTKRLRVETVKPNRLKIDLKVPEKPIVSNRTVAVPLHAEWLQGATARNLKYTLDAKFYSIATHFDRYPSHTFDNPARQFDQESLQIADGTLDEHGNADIELNLSAGNRGPGMMRLDLLTRVYEESGDFSIDGSTAVYSPYAAYAGIKSPQTSRMQLNTGTSYAYDIVAVDWEGKPQPDTELEVAIYKVEWYWWWSSNNGSLANYISNSYNKPSKIMTLTTKADGTARFNLKYSNNEWGTYFIQVRNRNSGHTTGIMNYFDWPDNWGRRDVEGADAATKLTMTTDKESYRPGEKMKVAFPSTASARAVVSIENGSKIIAISEHECRDKETSLEIDVTEEMMPNAYVHITLLQPHGATGNDLPIRLYGVKGVAVTAPESHLDPAITMKKELRPGEKYEIAVSESKGRRMAYSLAVVDEGLLDLTKFKTPDPWNAFNAREALGVATWDSYGFVMGAYGGRIEQIFSIGGSDEAAGGDGRNKINRFAPVVLFEGPFLLKKGETKKHTFTMPNYNGRVRVMVVASDGKAYGKADKSVVVRKPVMLLGTLPRLIGVGEEMIVPATVFATEKGVGQVAVKIECSKNMSVMGDASAALNFSDTGDKQARFRIRVGNKPGKGMVKITATGKGETTVYQTDIEIRTVRRPQVKVTPVVLQPKAAWKGTVVMPGADGTNSMSLEVSNVQPVNLSARLDYLLGYPHGCIEQITSKGFPQLYLSEFAALTAEQENVAQEAVKDVIKRMRSYYTVDGAFSYWPGESTIYGWTTAYATHFLCSAESKGYLVPNDMKRGALNNLSRTAKKWKPSTDNSSRSEELTQAYRLYVLALGGNPELGAMNRLKESDHLYDMTSWMLAAAYATAGRADVGRELTGRVKDITAQSYQYDYTFGSDTRDRALRLITLCLLDDGGQAAVLANEISQELGSDNWMSTQTTAFALAAVSEYTKRFQVGGEMNFTYHCGTKSANVKTQKNIWSEPMLSGGGRTTDIELRNNGNSTLFARIITEGTPDQGEELAYSRGISLEVKYLDSEHRPMTVNEIRQGETFTAIAIVKNPTSRSVNNLVISQIFPVGWEIINTRYLDKDESVSRSASANEGINYQDFRDDRVYSHVNHLPAGRQVKVAITLTAVYPGVFYLPPVYCEAMYDNLTRANSMGSTTVVQ